MIVLVGYDDLDDEADDDDEDDYDNDDEDDMLVMDFEMKMVTTNSADGAKGGLQWIATAVMTTTTTMMMTKRWNKQSDWRGCES